MEERRFTVVRGEVVHLPTTLGEIRAQLPPERRAEFDAEMYTTPLDQLERRALLGWALPPEAYEDEESLVARLRAGDHSDTSDRDGNPLDTGERP
ncbi:hypothetical protein [Embleya scabrispora]|uniref:hypothetical protein n=1 Tax=Embleya scabrispora TaxID=159449 RepID=UPI001F2077ED|nr:hypothetical protein [Embleya scabrispora]